MTNKQLLALSGWLSHGSDSYKRDRIAEDPAIRHNSMSENGGSLAYIYYDGSSWGRSPDGQMVVLYDVERSQNGGQIEVVRLHVKHSTRTLTTDIRWLLCALHRSR